MSTVEVRDAGPMLLSVLWWNPLEAALKERQRMLQHPDWAPTLGGHLRTDVVQRSCCLRVDNLTVSYPTAINYNSSP